MRSKTILFFLILSAILAVPVQSKPLLDIMKDTKIEVSYASNEKLINFEEIDNKKIWNYENISLRTYYLPNNDFEIDLILKEKPTDNTFYINLDLSDYDVYFQPSLIEEIKGDGWVVNDTHAYNEKLDMGIERPIKIVNSYALYKKNSLSGSGKIAHIFRPLIKDSKGKETWGLMNYDKGVMTITVDKEYLENAIYPVIIDPIIGKTDKGGSNFYNQNNVNTCQFNITENMAIHNITIYLNKGAGITNVTCGLYMMDCRDGQPTSWLVETDELLNWVGDGWITFNFSETYFWTKRTTIGFPWSVNETEIAIAWWASDNTRVYYDVGSYAFQWQRDTALYTEDVWVSRYIADGGADRIISAYLTYSTFTFPCPPSAGNGLFPGLAIGVSLLIIAAIFYLERR